MAETKIELASNEMGVDIQPEPTKFGRELGVGYSNMPFSVPYKDQYQVKKKDPITPKQMMTMLDTDGQARALFRLITLPIRAAMKNATFIPAEGGEAEAEFIEQMFTLPPNSGGMTVTFERIMEQILLGVFHGFSAFEQVYQKPEVGPLKGKFTLKKLAYRPPDTITFLTDKKGHYTGLRQQTFFNGEHIDVFIPRDDTFYYAANEAERAFWGKSYFRSAFYHYDMKVRLYYVMNLAAQRSAVGFRVGTHPVNPPKGLKRDFDIALMNLGLAQSMSMPEGYKVESLKEGGNFDFMSFINHHNSQMSKSVLADFFDQNQGTSANTTPMVDFGQKTNEFFTLMLKTIMGDIAANINHYLIPKFVKWNFDSDKYPKYQWGAFTDEQLEAVRYAFMDLAKVPQSSATPEFVRAAEQKVATMFDLDIDYSKVEEREIKEKAEAEKLAQQAPQGQANPRFSDRNDRNEQPRNTENRNNQ
jgi:hypothetical protein